MVAWRRRKAAAPGPRDASVQDGSDAEMGRGSSIVALPLPAATDESENKKMDPRALSCWRTFAAGGALLLLALILATHGGDDGGRLNLRVKEMGDAGWRLADARTKKAAAATAEDKPQWECYLANYADLEEGLPHTAEAALQHYLKKGIKEGREFLCIFPPDCSARCYVDNYPGLQESLPKTQGAALEHYVKFGIKEGRDCRCKVNKKAGENEVGAEVRAQSVPAKPAPAKPAPTKTAPAKTAPAKLAPAKLAPAKTAPAKTAPAKLAPAKLAPAKTAPAKMAPAKLAPAKLAPAKAAPAKAAPAKTAPAKLAPAKLAPAKAAPAKTAPAKTAPAKTAPGKTEEEVRAKAGTAVSFPPGCTWECYLDNYPGLQKGLQRTEKAALGHFLEFGLKEGRDCKCKG